MKKLSTLAIIFVLAGIILSSCHSSSVMKRRYNKGYYVHHKAMPSDPKTNATVTSNNVAEPLLVSPKNPEILPDANTNAIKDKAVATAAAVKNKTENKQAQTVKSNNKGLPGSLPAEYSIKHPVKTLKNISTELSSSGRADGDALSLLWILIVILLVLYLVGLLAGDFGIGGLIHILAVIILVLLILWLLRIL